MKVTIKDVAEEAKVATSTVSRVLSNSPRISDETKKRVHEAIKKLNYKPNAIARSLANNKTRILGVVLPSEAQDLLTNPFFINAMKGMSMYAQSKNYYITYAFSNDQENEEEHIKEITHNNLVDGVVLLRAREYDESIRYLKEIKFPFVVIGRPENTDGVLWVDNDNFQAMYNVVNRLIKKGHEKIGMVGAIKDWSMSKDRLKGYKMALEINGIKYDEKLTRCQDEFTEENGYEASKELIKDNKITAVVTTDDLLAIGAIKAINEENMKNIAVVGFNNSQLGQYQSPTLATVDINAEKLGYHATRLLIDNLEDDDSDNNRHYIVDTVFVERESFV